MNRMTALRFQTGGDITHARILFAIEEEEEQQHEQQQEQEEQVVVVVVVIVGAFLMTGLTLPGASLVVYTSTYSTRRIRMF